MTFEETMAKVNDGEYWSLWDVDEYFEYNLKLTRLASGLNIDKHRWYEVTTSVYEVEGRFLGVRGLSQCFSEGSDAEDCCCESEAFEMEVKQTITYVKN